MAERSVRLHRVLKSKPKRAYRASLEPDAVAKWLPAHAFTCTVHRIDARVGGTFRMSFQNFTTGNSHSFGGEYLELGPGHRIRHTDKFEDPSMPRVRETTLSLEPVFCGAELHVGRR